MRKTLATGLAILGMAGVLSNKAYSQKIDSTEINTYSEKVREVKIHLDVPNVYLNPSEEIKKYNDLNSQDKERLVGHLAEAVDSYKEKYESEVKKFSTDASSNSDCQKKLSKVKKDVEYLSEENEIINRYLNRAKLSKEDEAALKEDLDELNNTK